jgi:hypothetical protein
MNLLKPIVKLFVLDSQKAFIIFWSILLLSTAAAILLSLSYSVIRMSFGSNIAVSIFLMIFAMHTVKETFPFALGMGSTRKAYYLGTILFFVLVATLTALLQSLYSVSLEFLLNLLGIEQITFVNLGLLERFEGQYLLIILFDFLIGLFLISLFYLIATIQYRFGLLPLLVLAVLSLLAAMLPEVQNLFISLVDIYTLSNGLTLLSLIFLVNIAVFFLLGWLVIRRSAIKSA